MKMSNSLLAKNMLSNNQQAFLALVRAGLWEEEVRLMPFGDIDFNVIYQLALEQTVVGLVAAGLEHVVDTKVPKDFALLIAGEVLKLEQRNKEMNIFVADLVAKLRSAGVYSLLIKGQGIAQCYERPLWRNSGDVDLLLSADNYKKAVNYITPMAVCINDEEEYTKHFSITIDKWEVELHGSLRNGLMQRFDKVIDFVQSEVFCGGLVRSWINGNTHIFLPREDEDVFFVFSHILQHFYKRGIGLRQICDWCRLLWTYKGNINTSILKGRLKRAGVLTEWKAFASLAVDVLGMPKDVVPLYSPSFYWSNKVSRIILFIFETGNFGHNRDFSYQNRFPFVLRKFLSLCRHTWDGVRYFFIFPKNSIKVWFCKVKCGLIAVAQQK